MSKKWYCKVNDKKSGPFSSAELVEMIREGKITPDTPVRKRDSQWVMARSVNGLFERAGVFTGQHRCPSCGSIISKPPTTCPTCNRTIEASPFAEPDI